MISFRQIAERMDPVRPPTRLAGVASSWLDEIDPTIWLLRPEIVEVVSSFTTRPQVGLMHRESKGLFQVHRWPREDSTAFGHTPLSLRAIADRHADPNWTFRFLWYNTWLLYPPLGISSKPLIEQRRREIGQAIARRPYQIAALCEVWNEDERKALRDIVGENHAYDWARGPAATGQLSSGLMTFAIDTVGIVSNLGWSYKARRLLPMALFSTGS